MKNNEPPYENGVPLWARLLREALIKKQEENP
jgi:hypothetical protein